MIGLTLTGGRVLRGGALREEPVSFAGGVFQGTSAARSIELPEGALVLPGIVDIHGDGFERHLAPRRGAMKDLSVGLQSTEAELSANGITTAMLAQFWSWEGGMRGPEFAQGFLAALRDFQPLGTDMRAQLRIEACLIPTEGPSLLSLVQDYAIKQVVINDHLPHRALEQGKRPPRLTGQALKSGRSPEAHLALMQELRQQWLSGAGAIAAFGQALAKDGVVVGSHDDSSAKDRENGRACGAGVSEFPCTREAVLAAAEAGEGVIMGAPNVVRGGSHDGNVSAEEMVLEGRVDALASDYHYPAPRQAALHLAEKIGLPTAWSLISEGPARLLGLKDRGAIAEGLRADLVVLDAANRIGLTVAGGKITYAAGPMAEALLG
ncbi:MAG: alpha-D-ribose 1-methylphosphonate 5-triphosphate diphosphatase [Rhodobacteraceae bacterium]|nr:alpha-D-ribose 1-methylphosphonate 5-triphosphate diphosphatase [Paracoccaceae bacterium]